MPVAKFVGSVLIVGLSLVAAGCSSLGDDVARDDEGQITETGEIGALRIKVGDCLGDLGSGLVESAPAIPCDQEHLFEVYHAFDLPDGDFPGSTTVGEAADDGCLSAFDGFVGLDFQSSIYGFTSLSPTQETWDRLDDREVLCLLSNFDGSNKSGSAQNSGQ